jgi:hypothetical protein
MGKGREMVNIVKYYVYMYINGKMVSVETIPGMGEGEDNNRGDEFKYVIFYAL